MMPHRRGKPEPGQWSERTWQIIDASKISPRLSVPEIATLFGVSRAWVYEVLKRNKRVGKKSHERGGI